MELTREHPLLNFPEVYALKVMGGQETYFGWAAGQAVFPDSFVLIYDEVIREYLTTALEAFGVENITVYGKYNSKYQFHIHDVKFNDDFLAVPHAASVATYLKLTFVRYKKMSTKSLRRIKKYKPVELRPLDEFVDEQGQRLIVQYLGKEK